MGLCGGGAGGNMRLKPHCANHSNMKKNRHKAAAFHLNSRFFMNGKCQIGFPKPLWPASHELTMLFW